MRRVSNIAAALAIAVVVLGLGGVHTIVAATAALLALLAAGLQIGHFARDESPVLISLVGLAAVAAVALCCAQLVPVPDVVHALLNPEGLRLVEHGAQLAGLDASTWRPLSLDPAATGDRAIRYVAIAAIALWAANVPGRRRWQVFSHWFVPLALVNFAVGFALLQTGAESFFGVYEPTVGFRGPSLFISTNHGAVFFGLAALVAAAAAIGMRRDRPVRAIAFGVATAVLVVAALAQNSDGVTLALVAAVIVGALVQWWRRGHPTNARIDMKVGIGVLALLAVVAAVWLDLHRLAWGFLERIVLSGEHGGRLELVLGGVSALGDYWRFGAGAGAIETMLPAYLDWSKLVPASIPVIENDVLEVLLSFGVFFGVLLLASPVLQIGLIARRAGDGQRSPRYAVAVVAAVYMAIVAQFHFPHFALGIAVPAVAWFELLWSGRSRSSHGRVLDSGHVVLNRRASIGVLASLFVAGLIGAQAAWVWYAPAPQLTNQQEIERELFLRPASHVPYVKLATAAARSGDVDRARVLAEHAMLREPSPRVRLYRAQLLSRVDADAAAREFEELLHDGHTSGAVVHELLRGVTDAAHRARVLEDHSDLWDSAATRIMQLDGPDASSSFVVALATRRPGDVRVYRLASSHYLRLGQPVLAELWAELVSDAEAARVGGEVEAPLLLARALRASGRVDEARLLLDEAASNPALVRAAHGVALELRGPIDPDRHDSLKRHHDAYCTSPVPKRDQRTCWDSEAWLLEASGDHVAAAQVYTRLHRRLGDPMPLARFYVRTHQCDDLTALLRQLDAGVAQRRVEALSARCVE